MAAILIRHKNVWNQPIRQSNASNRIQLRHLGTRAVFKISMPPFPSPKDIPKLEIRERVATNGGGGGGDGGGRSGGTSGAKVEWMVPRPSRTARLHE